MIIFEEVCHYSLRLCNVATHCFWDTLYNRVGDKEIGERIPCTDRPAYYAISGVTPLLGYSSAAVLFRPGSHVPRGTNYKARLRTYMRTCQRKIKKTSRIRTKETTSRSANQNFISTRTKDAAELFHTVPINVGILIRKVRHIVFCPREMFCNLPSSTHKTSFGYVMKLNVSGLD